MPDLTAVEWVGLRVDDVYGARLGKVEDVYLDTRTGEPAWLGVRLGRFGDDHVAVPAAEATVVREGVRVPYERQVVSSAGALTPGRAITRERDLALAGHYRLGDGRVAALRDAPPASVTCVSALAGDGQTVSG